MYYASFGILAIILHIVINFSAMKPVDKKTAPLYAVRYRLFLIVVMIYYLSDICWGFLMDLKNIPLVYADTVIYFFSMVLSVLLWTRYVVAYLDRKGLFGRILTYTGYAIFIYEILNLAINFFHPIVFYFTADKEYVPGRARYITLGIQVLLFTVTSVYTLFISSVKGTKEKIHNRAIGLSGIVMTVFILLQTFFPLLPFYAIGLLIGTCVVHVYVVEDERIDHNRELNIMREMAVNEHIESEKNRREQLRALNTEKELARRDELTGIKNKVAYTELVRAVQGNIDNGINYLPFALVVCDINDLKKINDTEGHVAGDEYIKASAAIICDIFDHSPVFRIGGDEFVVFLRGNDYSDRKELVEKIRGISHSNSVAGKGPVVAVGMSEFISGKDLNVSDTFARADSEMYKDKHELKTV
ncbi:MAG: GGDEF domain-containing protein [Lachnospiraceae bacterium]|nr:GGDEF domain-containing protein [Lachnospiraceae bacterium]